MKRLPYAPLVLFLVAVGCQTLVEEMPVAPSQVPASASDAPLIQVPIAVVPAPTPPLVGEPAPTPAPTPGPTPDPDEGADPTPTPAPVTTACAGIEITIDARCAGLTPDCGIDGSTKSPSVTPGSKVTLDASYYIDSPRNKIHDYDSCYPGPISHWDTPGGVDCKAPYSNNHVITCGPYDRRGAYDFRVCGGGTCRNVTVRVN